MKSSLAMFASFLATSAILLAHPESIRAEDCIPGMTINRYDQPYPHQHGRPSYVDDNQVITDDHREYREDDFNRQISQRQLEWELKRAVLRAKQSGFSGVKLIEQIDEILNRDKRKKWRQQSSEKESRGIRKRISIGTATKVAGTIENISPLKLKRNDDLDFDSSVDIAPRIMDNGVDAVNQTDERGAASGGKPKRPSKRRGRRGKKRSRKGQSKHRPAVTTESSVNENGASDREKSTGTAPPTPNSKSNEPEDASSSAKSRDEKKIEKADNSIQVNDDSDSTKDGNVNKTAGVRRFLFKPKPKRLRTKFDSTLEVSLGDAPSHEQNSNLDGKMNLLTNRKTMSRDEPEYGNSNTNSNTNINKNINVNDYRPSDSRVRGSLHGKVQAPYRKPSRRRSSVSRSEEADNVPPIRSADRKRSSKDDEDSHRASGGRYSDPEPGRFGFGRIPRPFGSVRRPPPRPRRPSSSPRKPSHREINIDGTVNFNLPGSSQPGETSPNGADY